MRVISGKFKKKKINPPRKITARPTTDQVKEGLFNILHHSMELEGIRILDLFAGTGNICYEFLSRGAESATAVDLDRVAINFIQKTSTELGVEIKTAKRDVFNFLKQHKEKFDVIFADPPYSLEGLSRIPRSVMDNDLLNTGGWLIVEHNGSEDLSDHPWYMEDRQYGKTYLSFFRKPMEEG